jgi:uncharacterized LabA/DUF88 family protein
MDDVRIFIDFWNLQLSIRDIDSNYRLDWKKISPLLVSETETLLGEQMRFVGTRVYMSYSSSPGGSNLKNWSINTLDRFPGISVIGKQRQVKRPPSCPNCHTLVKVCPHCGGNMQGTVEKGIDTAIVTDMVSLAWENAWDVAILVSSDKDFIPAVEFLNSKGYRVVNVHFPPAGIHLSRTCWGSIDLRSHLNKLNR